MWLCNWRLLLKLLMKCVLFIRFVFFTVVLNQRIFGLKIVSKYTSLTPIGYDFIHLFIERSNIPGISLTQTPENHEKHVFTNKIDVCSFEICLDISCFNGQSTSTMKINRLWVKRISCIGSVTVFNLHRTVLCQIDNKILVFGLWLGFSIFTEFFKNWTDPRWFVENLTEGWAKLECDDQGRIFSEIWQPLSSTTWMVQHETLALQLCMKSWTSWKSWHWKRPVCNSKTECQSNNHKTTTLSNT
jgi:hypothetical protein